MQPNVVETETSAPARAGKRVRRFRMPWIFALALATVLVLQGQGEMRLVLTPPSPEWSRPLTIATASSNRALAQVALPAGRLMIVWAGEKGFHSYVIGPSGQVEATSTFLEDQASPSGVRAVVIGDRVDLFWLNFSTHTLWTAAVAPTGQVLASAQSVASGVTEFAVTTGGTPAGPRLLALQGGGAAFYVPASGEGWQRLSQPTGLGGAVAVDVRGAADGTLYAAVARQDASGNPNVVHLLAARLAPAGSAEAFEVAQVSLQPMKEALGSLSLGLDKQNAYIFWDVERNDRGERSTLPRYVSWPLTQAPDAALEPQPLRPDPVQPPKASGLSGAYPAPGQFDQLLVAVPATIGAGRDRVVETLELTFEGGKMVRQRLAGPSSSITLQPQLSRTGADRWLTWVVPLGTQVQLQTGSTAASFRKTAGRWRLPDWLDTIGNTAVNLGFAYLPALISAIWILPVLGFIALSYMLFLNWAERNSLIVNLGGLAIYVVSKIYFSPQMLFTAKILARMPAWLAAHILWIVLATVVLAALEVLRKNRLAFSTSVASALAPLIFYDVILTALIAAPYFK